jgi:hypothetical protein
VSAAYDVGFGGVDVKTITWLDGAGSGGHELSAYFT